MSIGCLYTGIMLLSDMFLSLPSKSKSRKGASKTQRRSRGRIAVGSTDQIEPPFKSHVSFDATRNQPQAVEPISAKQASFDWIGFVERGSEGRRLASMLPFAFRSHR